MLGKEVGRHRAVAGIPRGLVHQQESALLDVFRRIIDPSQRAMAINLLELCANRGGTQLALVRPDQRIPLTFAVVEPALPAPTRAAFSIKSRPETSDSL